jgi:hypothetical protein
MGLLAAACSGSDGKALVIESRNGSVMLGNRDMAARLHTDGDLVVTSGAAPEDWYFDVLPNERSAQPLAPVCRIEANRVMGVALADAPTRGVRTAFAGQGVDPDGGPVTYRWEFGDGEGAEAMAPVHAYRSPGVYAVLFVRLADLPAAPVRGDEVEIGGVRYKVFDIEADAEGAAVLRLRKAG